MGLWDFAKQIGAKLFDREEEGGEKIQQHIEADNPGVEGLKVLVQNGVATISGNADDAVTVEKAVLMAGNVQGVEKVVSQISAPSLQIEVEYYEIASGDTLSGIAKKFYGNANKYNQIFEANKEVIKDPNKIYVGQKIRIPSEVQA